MPITQILEVPIKKFGFQAAIDTLQNVDEETRQKILKNVAKLNSGVAQKLKGELFTFEDLVRVNLKGIELIVAHFSGKILCLALRKASKNLLTHFFTGMSQRRAQSLKSDIESLGHQPLNRVEEAQREVVSQVLKWQAEGKLVITHPHDSDPLV